MRAGHADIVVVGGGVVGLSLAWRLAQVKAAVTVIDAGRADGQASVAAAGMLAPLAEAQRGGPLVGPGLDSLRRYPGFVSELSEATGVAVELSAAGMLRVAADPAEEEALAAAYAWQKSAGLPSDWLDGEAARSLEPGLSEGVRAAVLSPAEKHVEPGALLAALTEACRRRGVRIVAARATGFKSRGRRVVAVETEAGSSSCAVVAVAAGAWSGILARRLGVELPIFPVRGQMLALRRRPPVLRHAIYSRAGYLVPRAEGRVVVGATVEAVGFDPATTTAGEAGLRACARGLVPALGALPVEGLWAGLRPASGDGLPIIGSLPGWENAFLSTGHFRNGILLAPYSADLLSRTILEGVREPSLEPFSAERWAALPSPCRPRR